MADKTWKKRERGIAKRLGGRRLPVDGSRASVDVETPAFVVQSKHRSRRPAWLADALREIRARANERGRGQTGIVVLSVPHERTAEAIVLMALGDFEGLLGPIRPPDDAV
jgi:hypothetical protein